MSQSSGSECSHLWLSYWAHYISYSLVIMRFHATEDTHSVAMEYIFFSFCLFLPCVNLGELRFQMRSSFQKLRSPQCPEAQVSTYANDMRENLRLILLR